MSSAANDKRGKLEDEFRNRMYDAEATPSQDLWARIDHSLTVQESGEYRKRMVFYRQLAAACIALLLLVGGAGAYYFGGSPAEQPSLASVSPAPAAPEAAAPATASPETNAAQALADATPADATVQDRLTAPAANSLPRAAVAQAGAVQQAQQAEAIYTPESENQSQLAGTLPPANNTGAAPAETPLSRYRSIRSAMAALGNLNQKQVFDNATLGQMSLARQATVAPAPGAAQDFRKQSEEAMAHVKEQQEAQQALALAQSEALNAGARKAEQEKGGEKGRWSLGMAYAPSYFDQNIGIPNQMVNTASSRQSFTSLNPNATAMSSLYINQARDEYEENTDPGFSYGVEVKTGFRLGKKLKLLTGLGFLQNTARSKSSYVVQQFWGRAFSNSANDSNGPSTVFLPSISNNFASDSLVIAKAPEYKVNYRYRNLTVPLGLQYEGKLGKDWFWYGGAGVAANILLQTTVLASAADVENVEYDINENSPFRRLQWSGNVSAGVGKRLANNLSVTLGPEVRRYFTTLLAEPESTLAPQGKPYTLGLNMAVNYDLNGGKKSK